MQIVGVSGLPEINLGDDLAALILAAGDVVGGDVVVVTSKIVSKAEARSFELDDVTPSGFATEWATRWEKDPRVVELVLQGVQAHRADGRAGADHRDPPRLRVRQQRDRPELERCPRPRRSCCRRTATPRRSRIRSRFADLGVDVAVIVSDTFGRPWREGQTDVAAGIAGIAPMHSYIGEVDPHGHEFRVQELCVVDVLAGAAELVKGNTSRVPVAVIRGYDWQRDDAGLDEDRHPRRRARPLPLTGR